MLYVVCAYIAIGLLGIIFLPEHLEKNPKYTKTIFDREETKQVKDVIDEPIMPEMPYEQQILDGIEYDCIS